MRNQSNLKKVNMLQKEIAKIEEINLNWDYPSIEKLIEKYKNTSHTKIKEKLYDVVNNWFSLLSYDYECEKVIEDKYAYIEDNLLYHLSLLSKLKPNSHLESGKCYWLQELASLEKGKNEKEKWLQKAYSTIDKALEVYGNDLELRFIKISLILQWEVIQQSKERRMELDSLVTSVLDSLENYPFLDITRLFLSNVWMSERGNEAISRLYFHKFLDRIEKMFSNEPELRIDFVSILADYHDEDNENALQNLQLIYSNSHLILSNQITVNDKYSKLARELLKLSSGLSDLKWKRKICLLAEEFFKILHQAFPENLKYISGLIRIYDEIIMIEFSLSKKVALANNYFEMMHELINQSMAIDRKYEASSYANKLKKYNHLLFQNGNTDLNKQAIELYKRDIEKTRDISMRFGTEVFSFSSDDRNHLAECYLLQGKSDKALKVVQEHALMLEKQKKKYKGYSQFDILKLLEKKEFEPIHEKIKTFSNPNN
jgi:hypothetical protein